MAPTETPRLATEPPGQPPRTGSLHFDLIAALAAIFISLVSMIVAIRSEAVQTALLEESAWPFIQLNVTRDSAAGDTIEVDNDGVGPAKIMSLEVFFDGQPIESLAEFLRICCGFQGGSVERANIDDFHLSFGDIAGNVLRPDRHLLLVSMRPGTSSRDIFDRFDAALGRITLRACYCSILQQCWISDLRGLDPQKVDRCTVASHRFTINPPGDGK